MTAISQRKSAFKNVRRLVIKIGSGVLTRDDGIRTSFFSKLAKEVIALRKKGMQVAIVSSGAVACGMSLLNLKTRPKQISEKQAAAALGQPLLMNHYSRVFQKLKCAVGQMLLTRDDLQDRHRYLTAKHAIMELFNYQAIPIINENDSVAVDEIKVGDNDQLSALVAHLIEAQLLIIMTDIDGFYDKDPKKNADAQRIPIVENVDENTFELAQDTLSEKSVGGMVTKLKAAQQAACYGVATAVVSGDDPKIIRDLLGGKDVGTLFLPRQDPLSSRKYWIAYTLKPKGEIVIDEGAASALKEKKKSLLSSGIREVRGQFDIGDCITILNSDGLPLARGLVSYAASELMRIKGVKSADIEKILGYKYSDEVVNRDDLVIL